MHRVFNSGCPLGIGDVLFSKGESQHSDEALERAVAVMLVGPNGPFSLLEHYISTGQLSEVGAESKPAEPPPVVVASQVEDESAPAQVDAASGVAPAAPGESAPEAATGLAAPEPPAKPRLARRSRG